MCEHYPKLLLFFCFPYVSDIRMYTGQKRKQDSDRVLASLVEVIERAEERASQREEKMRRMELEMEEKMREREDRYEMQMFSMFTAVMQQMNSSALP